MTDNNQNILFDKFEIIECFKKDEYTAVYLANHIYLNKKIILKSLNTSTAPDNSVTERFKREAKILAQLDHPNIIKVLDFGTYDKYFYISFEYFHGSSLREVIKKNGINAEEKREVVVNILQGLTEAHNNGIIHRDIKPENIFVDKNLRVKIGDFGLALSKTESFVTSKSAIVGTPCYMSPEQVSGSKLTNQSDLFSFGVVVYELYNRVNPFLGNDISESINNILSKDYNKLFSSKEKIPEDISEMLGKLLVKNSNNRIESAADCLKLLGVEFITPDNYATISLPKTIKWIDLNNRKVVASFSLLVIVLASYFFIFGNNNLPQENTGDQNNTVIEQPLDNNTDNSQEEVPENLSENITEDEPADITNREQENNTDVTVAENTNPENRDNEQINNSENDETNEPVETLYGSLNIICRPWANIIIDSDEYDTTPIDKPITLSEGQHKLILSHPEYPTYEQSLDIIANQTTLVKVNLDTLFGYLECKVFPWGELYVNDIYRGQTPISNPLQLVPGNYTLKVLNPHFETINDTLVIRRNDTLKVQYSFKN